MLRLYFCVATLAALAPMAASAQSARTFVSGNGVDSNPCTIAAPCRSFTQALAQTNSGGELIILDSAGYGPLVVNKSVSITAPEGVYGGVTVPNGGIGVSIANNLKVTLRGLAINGAGVGATGISVTGANSSVVDVSNCVIQGVTGNGIYVSGGTTVVTDTSILKNAGSAVAVRALGFGTDPRVSLARVTLSNNDKGVNVSGPSNGYVYVTIDSSTVSSNATGYYIVTDTGISNETLLFSSNTNVANNNTSIVVGAGATLRLEKTSVSGWFGGGVTNNGQIYSFGDNAIADSITGNAPNAQPLR